MVSTVWIIKMLNICPQYNVHLFIYCNIVVIYSEQQYACKNVCLVAQSCPTLCDPLPGFSVHGIFQARILEWIAISSSRGSSWPRDWIWVSCMTGRFFTIWATGKSPSFLLGNAQSPELPCSLPWDMPYPLSTIFGSSDHKDSYPPGLEFPYFMVRRWKSTSVGLTSS